MIETTTAPKLEPITLQEARDHLRVDGSDDDGVIAAAIVAAREFVENYTSRPLVTQTRTGYLSTLEGCVALSANLQSVSSIKYIDCDGVQQTLATSEYRVDTKGLVGSVSPAFGKAWPSVRNVSNSVEIEFVCGYGGQSAVPCAIKQAMLLLIGDFFEMREETVIGAAITPTGAVGRLLSTYRIISL